MRVVPGGAARGFLLRKDAIRAVLVCSLAVLQFFAVPLVSVASAQVPSPAPGEVPTPPSVPTPPEEEEIPPPAPPALPGAPTPVDILDFQAPPPTAPPVVAPGLVDRFQQRLELVPAGQILFSLTVEGEYDDNVFGEQDDREDDFRIVIVPAVAVERVRKTSSLRLRYSPRILKYIDFTDEDRVDHSLVAAWSWDTTPWFRVSVRDSLLITEDTAEAGGRDTGLRRTIRNEVSPDLEFRLGPRSDLLVGYTNSFTDKEEVAGEEDDSWIHKGRIAFRHRRPRGGVSLAYTLTTAAFDESSDFLSHEASLRASRRVTPRDELLFLAAGLLQDEDDDPDFTIITAGAGVTHEFSPQVSGTLTGGIQRFDEDDSDAEIGFATISNLTWTFPRGSLRLGVDQRFEETSDSVDNVGVVHILRGSASFAYQVGPRLDVVVNGSAAREDFEEEDRLDMVYRVGVDIRYRLSRLFTLTAGYTRFDRDSDKGGQDLTRNRVFIGLSVGYATPLPF